jgi:rhodanese-related sulfurtransferase
MLQVPRHVLIGCRSTVTLRPTVRRNCVMMASCPTDGGPAECKELLKEGFSYLDVRTPEEFGAGHCDGAANVPIMFKQGNNMEMNAGFLEAIRSSYPDKASKLVVGCASGKRSQKAIDVMKADGYTNLTNLNGGYTAWVQAEV